MLEYRDWKFFKDLETSLKKRVLFKVGFWLSLLLMGLFLFFAILFWDYAISSTTNSASEFSQSSSNALKVRIYRAIGVARALSMSADYMMHTNAAAADSNLSRSLYNYNTRLNHYKGILLYQSAYYSFDAAQLGRVDGVRLFYQSTYTRPAAVCQKMAGIGDGELQVNLRKAEEFKQAIVSIPHESSYNDGGPSVKVISVAAPVEHDGKVIGSAGVDLPLEEINQLIKSFKLPPHAVAYLLAPNGEVASYSSEISDSRMKYISENKLLYKTISDILGEKGEVEGQGVEIKDNGMQSFILPVILDETNARWVFVVSVPTSVYYALIWLKLGLLLLVTVIMLVVVLVVVRKMAIQVVKPIIEINGSIQRLARGEIFGSNYVELHHKDELGEIAGSINKLIDSQKEAAEFAVAIGQEKFDVDLADRTGDDMAAALVAMKENLLKSKNLELERQEQEAITHWAAEGMAQFAELLRASDSNMKEFSARLLSSLVRYIDVNQGALFVFNEESKVLEMTACFAYNRRKMVDKEMAVGEGLVGRCYAEAESIYLLEIPTDYIAITSGLGDTPPRSLLLVPMKVDGEVLGVLELASLQEIPDYKLQFVEKIGESIAATIRSVRVNHHTAQLLERTKVQAEEMAAAEEEMRQNLEELQSTQEEMSRIQEEQRAAIELTQIDKQMFAALFHSTSESIYFKHRDGRYGRVSDAACALLRVNSVEEAVGKTAFDLFPHETASVIEKEDNEVMTTQRPIVRQEGFLTNLDGSKIKVEKSKHPVLDAKGESIGLIAIYKMLEN